MKILSNAPLTPNLVNFNRTGIFASCESLIKGALDNFNIIPRFFSKKLTFLFDQVCYHVK